nr:type II secretion system protein GspG [Chiayiivirga flava]
MLAVASALFIAVFGSACSLRRVHMARAQLASLEGKIEQFRLDTGRLPSTLHELTLPGNAGLGPYSRPSELRDPWGEPLYYRVLNARALSASPDYTLFTLGSDGRLGGSDDAADLLVPDPDP